MVYVSMTHDGISPEDAERLLVRPMEQEMRTIEGIDEMTANAHEGGANVMIRFDAGTDVDKSRCRKSRAKVDAGKGQVAVRDRGAHGHGDQVRRVKIPMLVSESWRANVPERTLTAIARKT